MFGQRRCAARNSMAEVAALARNSFSHYCKRAEDVLVL